MLKLAHKRFDLRWYGIEMSAEFHNSRQKPGTRGGLLEGSVDVLNKAVNDLAHIGIADQMAKLANHPCDDLIKNIGQHWLLEQIEVGRDSVKANVFASTGVVT